MTKVSIVCWTFRHGGIDVLFNGLSKQNYKDFELILVDNRYEHRHEKVIQLANLLGINVVHVPEHRRNKHWYIGSSAANTGFMLADGEITMIITDYAYANPDWIEQHLKHHTNGSKVYVMSPTRYYLDLPEITNLRDDISIFKDFFDPSILSTLHPTTEATTQPPTNAPFDYKFTQPQGPIAHTYCHVKNDSFRTDICLDVGGSDENFDKGKGPWDNEFAYRFSMNGCTLINDLLAVTENLNPRVIPELRAKSWGWINQSLEVSEDGRWSYRDGEAYQNTRYAEMLAGKQSKSNNPYDMRERRKEIWHWRELSKEMKPIIPINDIPDSEWYK